MKEELIRIEDGLFAVEGREYRFDISVSRGECIGFYVDDHVTSGAAYLNIFKGFAHMKAGKIFAYGKRVDSTELERWLWLNCVTLDKRRYHSSELTAQDFIVDLGKYMNWRKKIRWVRRLRSPESYHMLKQMGLDISWNTKLVELSLPEYYRLAIFCVWFHDAQLLVLDRFTEILRQKDLEKLMQCVQLLLEQGTAVLLADLDETFLYRYSNRVDVVKNRRTCYRLYPEEFDHRLYSILGWERQSPRVEYSNFPAKSRVVLSVSDLTFSTLSPLHFQIRSGEIAFLRDENYKTASHLRNCFLGQESWTGGEFRMNGKPYLYRDLVKAVGIEIGIQTERPNRAGGVLFHNLTALDNLSICLLPKAGRRFIRKEITNSILEEATRWFSREELLRPLSEWSPQQQLRFSYYKWFLLHPSLLVCFFPFSGQEAAYHEMIIDLLVTCARRGMAVWIVSSGIDAICEKTKNREFLKRLRYINE